MKLTSSQLRKIIREELSEAADPQQALLPAELKSKWMDMNAEVVNIMASLGIHDMRPPAFLEMVAAGQDLLNAWEVSPEDLQLMIKYGKTLYSRTDELEEGNKASKSVGDPPYREQGATESQAQQKAAGMALSARRGDTAVSKLKGAAKDLYDGEINTKDLRNLAKLGQKVKGHKTKEPKHLKSLPGHATPAKD